MAAKSAEADGKGQGIKVSWIIDTFTEFCCGD